MRRSPAQSWSASAASAGQAADCTHKSSCDRLVVLLSSLVACLYKSDDLRPPTNLNSETIETAAYGIYNLYGSIQFRAGDFELA